MGKGTSRHQPYARPHRQPQATQLHQHEQQTLHSQQTQESQEQQSQEKLTQSQKKWSEKMKSLVGKPVSWLWSSQSSSSQADLTQPTSRQTSSTAMDTGSHMLGIETRSKGEECVRSDNWSTGATDHEQSRLYSSLSDYQATESGQQYSYEELAAAMAPDRIERRMRLRQELRDSLRGIPIPSQPEVETARVAREAHVRRPENDIQGIYANAPLSPAEINIVMHKRRQSIGTNPEDLRRLEDCLPNINSSLDRPPRHQRCRKISLSQGTQTEDSDIKREHGKTNLETAASSSHARGNRRHGQEDVSPKNADAAEGTEDKEEDRLVRRARHRMNSQPQCHECEQNVTNESNPSSTTRPKRPADRLPTSDPEESSVTQSHQDIEKRPKKQRNIKVIPGRFSALDSSDEEQDQQEYDHRQARRRLKRMKLYNPRIDEVMEWTHDSSWKPTTLDTWRCPECEQRTQKTEQSCTFCSAPRPGPPILNTIPIWRLRKMEREAKNMEKSSNLNGVDSNTRAVASVSGSTGLLISIPMTPASVPVATIAVPPPSANAISGGSFLGSQFAPATATTTPMTTSAAGTLGSVPSSNTGIHVILGMSLTQSSSVTSPQRFNITTVPLTTTNATTTASFNFGSTSSPLQIPQTVQRSFQFGGFNVPSSFSFTAPVTTTRVSANTSGVPSSVLGPVVTKAITASPLTSISAAPLSFNPFAAASAAVLGPFASAAVSSVAAVTLPAVSSSAGLTTSVPASTVAGPTHGISINYFTTVPTTATFASGLKLNTQLTQSASSSTPLRGSITTNASVTGAGSSMFAFHNPSTPVVPQPADPASTHTTPTGYNFFSRPTSSVATAATPAPRPLGELGGSGAYGFGSTSSTANAIFNVGQTTTITPTPTSSSPGFSASPQTSNMPSGSTGGLFGNGLTQSANYCAPTACATTSGSGDRGFGNTLIAPPGNILTAGSGFGTSGMSGVQGSTGPLGALAGASVGLATGSGFGASNATSRISGMTTGSGLSGGFNFTFGPGTPSTSAPTNPSQPNRTRRPYDRRKSKKRM